MEETNTNGQISGQTDLSIRLGGYSPHAGQSIGICFPTLVLLSAIFNVCGTEQSTQEVSVQLLESWDIYRKRDAFCLIEAPA